MGSAVTLSPQQVDLARHALGLSGRIKQSYRNHFVTGPGPGNDDHAQWMAMVEMGAARRWPARAMFGGDDLFRLTHAGAEAALRRGERLDDEDFPQAVGAQP